MSDKAKRALRNLKIGGIYTPILFGVLFVSMTALLRFVDPSGQLSQKFNNLPFYNPPCFAIGGFLIFFGLNTLIYFQRFLKIINSEQ